MKVLLQSLRSVCLRIENRLTAQIVRLQGSLDAVRDVAHAALTHAVSIQIAAESKMERTNPVGYGSFSMGRKAGTTVGSYSHAEGWDTTASGSRSHAEGYNTTASGYYSHAEGYYTQANGSQSHAEGGSTTASGDCSHAEGAGAKASSYSSHAEGYYTQANGSHSHAEGYYTQANGSHSHAEGDHTKAARRSQHVEGEYNIAETVDTYERGEYVHIVGNGTSDSARSNAHTLDWKGNAWFAGDVYVGSTSGTNRDDGSKKLVTEDSIPTALPNPHKLTLTGAVKAEYDGSAAVSVEIPAGGGGDSSLGITGASVGQTVKITEVDDNGRPTAWEAVEAHPEFKLIGTLDVSTGDTQELEFDAPMRELMIVTNIIDSAGGEYGGSTSNGRRVLRFLSTGLPGRTDQAWWPLVYEIGLCKHALGLQHTFKIECGNEISSGTVYSGLSATATQTALFVRNTDNLHYFAGMISGVRMVLALNEGVENTASGSVKIYGKYA